MRFKTLAALTLLTMSLTVTSHSTAAWACENGKDGQGLTPNGGTGDGYGCSGGNGYPGIGYDPSGLPVNGGNGGAGLHGAGGGNGGNSQYGEPGKAGSGSCDSQGNCSPGGKLGTPGLWVIPDNPNTLP